MAPDEAGGLPPRPPSVASSDDEYMIDDWPKMPDGQAWDGNDLLNMCRNGASPFQGSWDVGVFLQEIESSMSAGVEDIPQVSYGSNNYGVYIRLSDQREILARLARADVNMPRYDGFSLYWLHPQFDFETNLLTFLGNTSEIPTSPFLFKRPSVQRPGPKLETPKDITGLQLMIFEATKGGQNKWWDLNEEQKIALLERVGTLRAGILDLPLPPGFAEKWMLWSTFQPIEWAPKKLPSPVRGTREYCISMMKARVEAIIGNKGDIIGWEEDNNVVTDDLLVAKANLLRLIPHILPTTEDEAALYRLVLQHDDYGIHNMSIFVGEDEDLDVTSIYDWETGCIVPVILSEIEFGIAGYDMTIDFNGKPALDIRMPSPPTPEEILRNEQYAARFLEAIKKQAPYLGNALEAGNDARHVWVTLKKWKGEDPEAYFVSLGSWAEKRLRDLGINEHGASDHSVASRVSENEGQEIGKTCPVVKPTLGVTDGPNSNL